MKQKYMKQKLVVAALAGTIVIPGKAFTVHAADDYVLPTAGIETVLEQCYQSSVQHPIELYLVPTEQGEYSNRAFANIEEEYVYVRSAPNTESDWTGKLYSGNIATVLGVEGDYTQVTSGNVTGYVPTADLLTGGAAKEYAVNQVKETATVTATVLNVRDGQSTDANIITQINYNEKYAVLGEPINGWYPIQVGNISGWSCGDYLEVADNLSYAESKEEEAARIAKEEADKNAVEETAAVQTVQTTPAASGSGQAIIDYACQFVGNPYVWGGTSLTDGCDCSGFVQSVYAHFGVSLPRTTWDMENVGTAISADAAMPGDIFLYDGHVGLYMGDGTIVNAMNETYGIVVSDALFSSLVTIRRVI
ncbi:MAG: NlpC/P60 family protein [Hespellia sp.]|nr:NlpC/P60 family protein [Hespellia sp.]